MSPELIQKIQTLYLEGNSLREIISLGYTQWSVVKACRPIFRSKTEALLLRKSNQEKSQTRRACHSRARKIWERLYGPIPDGFHIHHKDKDWKNNAISNLECISASEHSKLHWANNDIPIPIRKSNPTPRHLRPKRKAYMKIYLKAYHQRKKDASKVS